MNHKRIAKHISLFFIGTILCFSTLQASDEVAETELSEEVQQGMYLFDGSLSFDNGGPSCITCHNVTNDNLIPGGLFAADLTEKGGVSAIAMAKSLPYPAMKKAYGDHPIEEYELEYLGAFFDYAKVNKNSKADTGYLYFLIGGLVGIAILFLLVQVIWVNRKKRMVKDTIFARQNKAWDAKF